MMLLRYWNNDHTFRAGIHVLQNRLENERERRYLSDVAEVVLDHLVTWIHEEFAQTHGILPGAEIVLCAMGNLGARQFSIGSDLDLIIIYDFLPETMMSNGIKPLLPSEYVIRLSKRLITAITAKTAQGVLYDVDMRLRPSGAAGPLALRFESFADYQLNKAQTWEHMALTKERTLGTRSALALRLEQTIHEVLTMVRDPDTLRQDIIIMRQRIETEYGTKNPWNLKYVRGGLIDIDFILQYLLLRHAHDHPEILSPDSETSFRCLGAKGLIAQEVMQDLIDIQRLWRHLKTYLRVIQGQDIVEPPLGLVTGLRRIIFPDHKLPIDFAELESHVRDRQKCIYGYFQSIIEDDDGSDVSS